MVLALAGDSTTTSARSRPPAPPPPSPPLPVFCTLGAALAATFFLGGALTSLVFFAAALAMNSLSQPHVAPTSSARAEPVELEVHDDRGAQVDPQTGARRQLADVARHL